MAELLPNSIADERFRLLDKVAAARFTGVDLTRVLVNLVDHVEASALPALGWAFGAIDEAWNAATTVERRALIKRVIARRRKRGTPWAIRDALAALGHDSSIREGAQIQLRHDGTVRRDGTFTYGSQSGKFWFWAVVSGDRPRTLLRNVVEAWKRRSTRHEVFYVPDAGAAADTLMYSAVPYGSLDCFDATFDMTFAGPTLPDHLTPTDDLFDDTFDSTYE